MKILHLVSFIMSHYFTGEHCGRGYVVAARLKHHRLECSAGTKSPTFTCKVCSKTFEDFMNYYQHVPVHAFMWFDQTIQILKMRMFALNQAWFYRTTRIYINRNRCDTLVVCIKIDHWWWILLEKVFIYSFIMSNMLSNSIRNQKSPLRLHDDCYNVYHLPNSYRFSYAVSLTEAKGSPRN